MRTMSLATIAVASLLAAAPAHAQQGSPPTTPTTVTRVTLVRIKPGHGTAYWNDIRQHLKPLADEYKRRGITVNYSVFTKVTTENENDWNVGFVTTYKNWAALDDFASKTDPLTLAHYGSADQRTAAGNARIEHSTVVSSFLLRDQTVNDWK